MSPTWTCAKRLTLSRMTSLALNWRDLESMDEPLCGSGMGWMIALKALWSMASYPSGDWVGIGTGAV